MLIHYVLDNFRNRCRFDWPMYGFVCLQNKCLSAKPGAVARIVGTHKLRDQRTCFVQVGLIFDDNHIGFH